MSTILAIESSSEVASVALLLNGEILTRETSGAQTHSQTVLPMVRELLSLAGIGVQQCDAIAFGRGPGSFTGVRTACGLAQGIAFGANLKVVPVVTLEAMAHACRMEAGTESVLPVLDARMGEVYWAQYRYQNDAWSAVFEPALSSPDAIQPDGNPIVCGNGIAAYCERFKELLQTRQHISTVLIPHARQIAELAAIKLRLGLAVSPQDAQPFYLRNKVALTSLERAAGLQA